MISIDVLGTDIARTLRAGDILAGTVTWFKHDTVLATSICLYLECIEKAQAEANPNNALRTHEVTHLRRKMLLFGTESERQPTTLKGNKKLTWKFSVQIPEGLPASVTAAPVPDGVNHLPPESRCSVTWRLHALTKLKQRKDHSDIINFRVSGLPTADPRAFIGLTRTRSSGHVPGGTIDIDCSYAALPQSGIVGIVVPGEQIRFQANIINKNSSKKATKTNTATKLVVGLVAVWRVGNPKYAHNLTPKEVVPEEQLVKQYTFRPAATPGVTVVGMQSYFPVCPGQNFRADLSIGIPADVPTTINTMLTFSMDYMLVFSVFVGDVRKPKADKKVTETRLPLLFARNSGTTAKVAMNDEPQSAPSFPPSAPSIYGSPAHALPYGASPAFSAHLAPSEQLAGLHIGPGPAGESPAAPPPTNPAYRNVGIYGGNPAGHASYGAASAHIGMSGPAQYGGSTNPVVYGRTAKASAYAEAVSLPLYTYGAVTHIPVHEGATGAPLTFETNPEWYFPTFSRPDAEQRLIRAGGRAFLIRNTGVDGQALILSKHDASTGRTNHYLLSHSEAGWSVEDSALGDHTKYRSLPDLVARSRDLLGYRPTGVDRTMPTSAHAQYGIAPTAQLPARNADANLEYPVSPPLYPQRQSHGDSSNELASSIRGIAPRRLEPSGLLQPTPLIWRAPAPSHTAGEHDDASGYHLPTPQLYQVE